MDILHEIYMKRCLEIAKLGERRVAPNPMVGSIIVNNNKIIGEGFHQAYGGPHAEVNAINSVKDKSLLKTATIYVTLEPCSHHGKTPPCADLIVKYKIPNVVIGTTDPFAKVSGRGIEKLKAAGCSVSLGVLNNDCIELNRRFFTFHQKKRPYIILKWAQTADGFVDVLPESKKLGHPTWITNEMARIAVHKQRSTENAIFIGTDTALNDNPSLTLRDWDGIQPIRVVADRYNRLPKTLTIFDTNAETYTINLQKYNDHRRSESIIIEDNSKTISSLLKYFFKNDIQSVIVEGGPKMLQSFIDQNLWDEAHVYTGQLTFNKGIKAPAFSASPTQYDRFYNSELKVYRNT